MDESLTSLLMNGHLILLALKWLMHWYYFGNNDIAALARCRLKLSGNTELGIFCHIRAATLSGLLPERAKKLVTLVRFPLNILWVGD